MKTLKNETFTGERALYQARDLLIEGCRFEDGESHLKEGRDIEVSGSVFDFRYPIWYGKNYRINDCHFTPNARAAVWYMKDSTFSGCKIEAPKLFRRCKGLSIKDCELTDAEETLWLSKDIILENVTVKSGTYFGLECKNVRGVHLNIENKYVFDSAESIHLTDAHIVTKDAFWNCKHVIVENSVIEGEYIGWNSEDLTFINCRIISHQGLCYIDGLKLINCELIDTDLSFEYCSDIDADITSEIVSVKNPISGRIRAKGIGEVIRDNPEMDPKRTLIEVMGEDGLFHAL